MALLFCGQSTNRTGRSPSEGVPITLADRETIVSLGFLDVGRLKVGVDNPGRLWYHGYSEGRSER